MKQFASMFGKLFTGGMVRDPVDLSMKASAVADTVFKLMCEMAETGEKADDGVPLVDSLEVHCLLLQVAGRLISRSWELEVSPERETQVGPSELAGQKLGFVAASDIIISQMAMAAMRIDEQDAAKHGISIMVETQRMEKN